MAELADLQQQFIDVIKGSDPADFATSIIDHGSMSTLNRIEIYRKAYYLRLKECIETDHEILGFYLGDDLFDEMVIAYIHSNPSQQTSLRYFCEQLPGFLAQTAPFNNHPVIAELAQFERCLLSAFDAADADTANIEMLKQISVDDWPQIQFRLHPSVQRLNAHFNSIEIWQHLKQQQPPPTSEKINNHWLIWRNAERLTEFKSLDVCETIMLEGILQGLNYASLCERLTEFIPEEDVSTSSVQHIVNWLNLGIIRSLSLGDNHFIHEHTLKQSF